MLLKSTHFLLFSVASPSNSFTTSFTFKSSPAFGELVGTFDGVPAYSNQLNSTMTSEPHFFGGIYTGVKWQCVEYVRRYLQLTRGVTFSSVNSAFQIPTLAKFTTLNGYDIHVSNDLKVGSVIVWPKDFEPDSPDGHVAVVTAVKVDGIRVAEQNYDDVTFPRFVDWSRLKDATIISVPDYFIFKKDKMYRNLSKMKKRRFKS